MLLSPVAVGLLILYSYGKRFTDFPQVLLALAQAVAPIGAWMGVTGGFAWPATALGLAVGSWIGGFDLIYSCQDAEIDRQIGSRSFPARFGIAAALRWSTHHPPGHGRLLRLVRAGRRAGLAVVARAGDHRRGAGLRAPDRQGR